jgi:hypothetical protein
VSRLDGADEAEAYLKRTALRDFGPPPQTGDDPEDDDLEGGEAGEDPAGDDAGGLIDVALRIDRADAPVPNLLRYALVLVGLKSYGPGEKVAWWVNFAYRGEDCTLAFQKFGLRLYLRTSLRDAEAEKRLWEIAKKLRSATTHVERLVLAAAPDLLARGAATVVNQHYQLHSAYLYFRERAVDPEYICRRPSVSWPEYSADRWPTAGVSHPAITTVVQSATQRRQSVVSSPGSSQISRWTAGLGWARTRRPTRSSRLSL